MGTATMSDADGWDVPDGRLAQAHGEDIRHVTTSREAVLQALRRVTVLDGLSAEDLCWLAVNGTEKRFADGEVIFRDNEIAGELTIILAGEIQVKRNRNGTMTVFIGRSGQLTGKLPFSRMKTYGGEGFAVGDLWMLTLPESRFEEMLAAIPDMRQRCVSVLLDRVREVTRIEQQAEKLNALGKLSANLSHELNNPASAARSAASSLWTELRNYGDQKYRLGSQCFTPEISEQYGAWVREVRDLIPPPGVHKVPDAVALSEREEAMSDWLDRHHIPDGWKLVPSLSETSIETHHLDKLASFLDEQALPVSLSAFASALKAERLTDAVVESTARIFDLIAAIKAYSYMDQAPIQDVDLPAALETTLSMLGSRLSNVQIVREYEGTPRVSAFGGELNQVWTALIENALDAMDGTVEHPELRLRCLNSGRDVLVEVWDNGSGIDPGIRSRIFEPFFTTKGVGVSLGLGLDAANRIVTRHRGQITVESKPGATCFQVRLPVEQAGAY